MHRGCIVWRWGWPAACAMIRALLTPSPRRPGGLGAAAQCSESRQSHSLAAACSRSHSLGGCPPAPPGRPAPPARRRAQQRQQRRPAAPPLRCAGGRSRIAGGRRHGRPWGGAPGDVQLPAVVPAPPRLARLAAAAVHGAPARPQVPEAHHDDAELLRPQHRGHDAAASLAARDENPRAQGDMSVPGLTALMCLARGGCPPSQRPGRVCAVHALPPARGQSLARDEGWCTLPACGSSQLETDPAGLLCLDACSSSDAAPSTRPTQGCRFASECLTALVPPLSLAPPEQLAAPRHSSPLKRRRTWWLGGCPAHHHLNSPLCPHVTEHSPPCRASAVEAHWPAASRKPVTLRVRRAWSSVSIR